MGAFYEGVRAAGGRVHGITHRMFVEPGGSGSSRTKEDAGELESLEIVEGKDLTMRKRRLLDAGDCLVALAGGVGTLDELFMAVTENGVAMFSKGCTLPILLLNGDGRMMQTDARVPIMVRARRGPSARRSSIGRKKKKRPRKLGGRPSRRT